MFNQFGRPRPNPSNPAGFARPNPSQPAVSGQTNSQFKAQYKPDFLPASSKPSSPQPGPAHMARTASDAFKQMAPESQRAALYDQARRQTTEAHQVNYQRMRDPSSALPGGLSEKQRMDFKLLQRASPAAAEKQLQNYQRTSDIRYNKPQSAPQPPASSTNRRPPSNFNGPRPHFGM